MSRRLLLICAVFVVCQLPKAMADLIDEDPLPETEVTPTPTPEGSEKVMPRKAGSKKPPKGVQRKRAPGTTLPRKAPRTQRPKESGVTTSVLAPKTKKKPKKNADKEPVHFESRGLKGLRKKGRVELIKDVIVTQGQLRMEAEHAVIFFDEATNDVQRVVADGKVKFFKVDEETGDRIKAFGNRAVFENKKRKVILEGNARLWRGTDLVKGKKITYELDSGWIFADRVSGEVHPDESKPTP